MSDQDVVMKWQKIPEQFYVALGTRAVSVLPKFGFVTSPKRITRTHADLVLERKRAFLYYRFSFDAFCLSFVFFKNFFASA